MRKPKHRVVKLSDEDPEPRSDHEVSMLCPYLNYNTLKYSEINKILEEENMKILVQIKAKVNELTDRTNHKEVNKS